MHNNEMARAQDILDTLIDAVEADGFRAIGIHVLVGDEAASHLWHNDTRRDVQSVAKAVCVIAAAMAADEGIFDIDGPVSQYFPNVTLGEGVEHVTVRHLLSMTSGIDLPWSPTLMTDWPDLAHEFLSRATQGRTFQYSNASTYTAMRALATAVGDVSAWVNSRFFAPLGIQEPHWDRCPGGWVVAGGGLHLSLNELARCAQLIRDGGTWQGTRLVDERWITAMHSNWTVCEGPRGYERYALAGWDGPGAAWRLHGAYGQLVVFTGDAVVTVTADDHEGADLMCERIVGAVRLAR
ncbi:MAG: serine hydrolase domain-containing protein [Microbacteriaceae bacterium]